MKKTLMHLGFGLPLTLLALSPAHAEVAPLKVEVEGIAADGTISPQTALCLPTPDGKSEKVKAVPRPTIRWTGVPAGTKSLALFVIDPDVPLDFTDASKPGKTLAADAPRQEFFHYGLVNIAADARVLPGGAATQAPATGHELLNDLGAQKYVTPPTSYGGPCPPFNDARLHHYRFVILALDTDAAVANAATTPARQVYDQLIHSKHVLAQGSVTGSYTLNPALLRR